MRLVLFRHGIAIDRDHPDCPPNDADRALTEKGTKRTREAAAGLAKLVGEVDHLWSSPLLRARQTADLAAEAMAIPAAKRRIVEALDHDRPPAEIFEVLARLRGAKTVVCAGHAPNLDEVLRHALDGGGTPVSALKKAGAACIQLSKAGQPGGKLLWLLEPSMLRALGE